MQATVAHCGVACKRRGRKRSDPIDGPAVFEVPPTGGRRIGRLVRLEIREGSGIERAVIDAGIVDGAREPGRFLRVRREVPQAEDDEAVVAESLNLVRGVGGLPLPVAENLDLPSPIDDGDLNGLSHRRRLGGYAGLILLRAFVEIASRHPLPGGDLAEDDAVEDASGLLDGENTAAALREIGRTDPGDQGLVGLVLALSAPRPREAKAGRRQRQRPEFRLPTGWKHGVAEGRHGGVSKRV